MSMQTPLPSPTGGSTPPQGLPTPTPSPVKNVAPNVKTPKLAVPTPKPGVDPAAQMLADNLDALHNSGYSYCHLRHLLLCYKKKKEIDFNQVKKAAGIIARCF